MNVEQIEKVNNVINKAKGVVYGQDKLLESIIAAIVCEGHLLIEGMPGLGKTLTVHVISKLCDLGFKRIQFTSDLLPSDILGFNIISNDKLSFQKGPIFTNIVLADELNRGSPKSQSAFLEAMEEKNVSTFLTLSQLNIGVITKYNVRLEERKLSFNHIYRYG